VASYHYLVPNITLAAPPGYRLAQFLPAATLRQLIEASDAELAVRFEICGGGRVKSTSEAVIRLHNGEWTDPRALRFDSIGAEGNAWISGADIEYLETRITPIDQTTFRSNQQPSYYTVFSAPGRKTCFLDNTLKFSDPVTINQIAAYGIWVEGYPACEVDAAADIDCSFMLINPFERPAVATFEFEGRDERPRLRVAPMSGRRVSFAEQLGGRSARWKGQVYVHGRNRLVAYFASHSYRDPCCLNTLEHTDAYRGRDRNYPFTQALYLRREQGRMLEG